METDRDLIVLLIHSRLHRLLEAFTVDNSNGAREIRYRGIKLSDSNPDVFDVRKLLLQFIGNFHSYSLYEELSFSKLFL